MLLQDSDKPPVTLHDVAAYFSEEEWKLLHEWQKELYKNVMNEIHQALVSLGMHSLLFCPLIVTSVCSLRARDKEDTCPVDSQSSGRSYCGKPTPTSNEVVSVVIKEEEEEPDDAENQESIHSPIADPVITSVFTLSRNPQDEMNFQEQTQPEEEHMAEPVITFVCSLSNKPDDEMNFQQEPEHEEQTTEEQITTRKEEKEKHQNPKKLSHRHKKLHHHPGTTSAVCERVVESADAGQQLIISPKPKCTEEEDMTWSALAINGPVHNDLFLYFSGQQITLEKQKKDKGHKHQQIKHEQYNKIQRPPSYTRAMRDKNHALIPILPQTSETTMTTTTIPTLSTSLQTATPNTPKTQSSRVERRVRKVTNTRSWVWDYFDVPYMQNVKTATVVKCNICFKSIKRGDPQKYCLGTSSMSGHLKTQHSTAYKTYLRKLQSKAEEQTSELPIQSLPAM
ncbi:uncharacterized protein [Ambystoma mexicanum]|uniref:uncharacterized protein isoform X3 n=1 Tax=Ambystoma mexicanum TaxID=8296 RepID=UPI0037E98999